MIFAIVMFILAGLIFLEGSVTIALLFSEPSFFPRWGTISLGVLITIFIALLIIIGCLV